MSQAAGEDAEGLGAALAATTSAAARGRYSPMKFISHNVNSGIHDDQGHLSEPTGLHESCTRVIHRGQSLTG